MKAFVVGVRVLRTGFRAVFVDRALVIAAEKRAWAFVKDIIALFIKMQVLVYKCGRAHFEVACNTLDITVPKDRACRLTAIAACKTVCVLKDFIMQLGYRLVQLARRLSFDSLKVLFIGPFVSLCPLL